MLHLRLQLAHLRNVVLHFGRSDRKQHIPIARAVAFHSHEQHICASHLSHHERTGETTKLTTFIWTTHRSHPFLWQLVSFPLIVWFAAKLSFRCTKFTCELTCELTQSCSRLCLFIAGTRPGSVDIGIVPGGLEIVVVVIVVRMMAVVLLRLVAWGNGCIQKLFLHKFHGILTW